MLAGKSVICIVHVDDLIFWATDDADIGKITNKLISIGVDLEEEDDTAQCATGVLEWKQTSLFDWLLGALGLDNRRVTGKVTPDQSRQLMKDKNGEGLSSGVNYFSMVGMLLYLAEHIHPDTAHDVSCMACYMFCLK